MSQLRIAQAAERPAQARPILSWPVQLAAIVSLSIYLHSLLWWTEPRDMSLFQRPWFEHIVQYGSVGAFAHPFSNYTPAYLYLLAIASLFHGTMAPMYLIKLLSVAGTAFAAVAVADLIKATGGNPRGALLLFLLPSAVINSALLAQCDALWAGLPVLTCTGNSFPGRVAASLLQAIGIPELVTSSLAGYEQLALALAQDPQRLAAIKAKLVANRDSAPLFDTARFTRGLESAYISMIERQRANLPPENFAVPNRN